MRVTSKIYIASASPIVASGDKAAELSLKLNIIEIYKFLVQEMAGKLDLVRN
jgi:hypothetical protein